MALADSEEGKSRSKGAFSSTSPQNVNSETACRPTDASESFCPEQGSMSGEKMVCSCLQKGSPPKPVGPELTSKSSVKVNSKRPVAPCSL